MGSDMYHSLVSTLIIDLGGGLKKMKDVTVLDV